ncbi:MAG: Gfo/Idh/MocA family oxidoreductase [Caldilineaceae bacterium]|nr:Gfo/Idh/MocA family oxidoreductase [Caldilineaceae bacterium]
MIGCGNISKQYFTVARRLPDIEIVACADLRREAAEAAAAQWKIPRVLGVDELLADPDIDIVLNLTIPGAHYEICLAALEAGKSVYVEKPLALTVEHGRHLLAVADEKRLRIGCAPDTFLGGGLQSARKLIDDGVIGAPVAATAFMMSRGHEHWHPNPEFYYKAGGGPMFDMGPYYLTALVVMLGGVRRVTGATRTTWPQRTILSQPLQGTVIDVDVPTHVVGLLDFETGPVGTIITTFDVKASALPRIEIYGTEGTLSLPDPNTFGGSTLLRRATDSEWAEIAPTYPNLEASRGLGLADMAHAIVHNRQHRASGELAFHVLEIMEAIHVASDQGKHVSLTSHCERPALLPIDLAEGAVA